MSWYRRSNRVPMRCLSSVKGASTPSSIASKPSSYCPPDASSWAAGVESFIRSRTRAANSLRSPSLPGSRLSGRSTTSCEEEPMKDSLPWLDQLRELVNQQGLPPQYVERLFEELRD